MFWILKIYLDKELRAKEIRRRKMFIEENRLFILELSKLNKQVKSLKADADDDNIYIKLMKEMNIPNVISVIQHINVFTNVMWISRKRVNNFEKYVKVTKDVVNDLIDESKINSRLDGFSTVQANKVVNSSKFTKLNLDKFINT